MTTKKEWEDNKEHDVEKSDFDSVEGRWALVLERGVHAVLSDAWPTLSGRHNEQSQHCIECVVVVERTQSPLSVLDSRRVIL